MFNGELTNGYHRAVGVIRANGVQIRLGDVLRGRDETNTQGLGGIVVHRLLGFLVVAELLKESRPDQPRNDSVDTDPLFRKGAPQTLGQIDDSGVQGSAEDRSLSRVPGCRTRCEGKRTSGFDNVVLGESYMRLG